MMMSKVIEHKLYDANNNYVGFAKEEQTVHCGYTFSIAEVNIINPESTTFYYVGMKNDETDEAYMKRFEEKNEAVDFMNFILSSDNMEEISEDMIAC